MSDGTALSGANADYLDALYEQYLKDPASVSEDWRRYFGALDSEPTAEAARDNGAGPGRLSASVSAHAGQQVKVLEMISAFRYRGHRQADLDPLKLVERPPALDLDAVVVARPIQVQAEPGVLLTQPGIHRHVVQRLVGALGGNHDAIAPSTPVEIVPRHSGVSGRHGGDLLHQCVG